MALWPREVMASARARRRLVEFRERGRRTEDGLKTRNYDIVSHDKEKEERTTKEKWEVAPYVGRRDATKRRRERVLRNGLMVTSA